MTSSDPDRERADSTATPTLGLIAALREDVGLHAISASMLWLLADRVSGLALSVVVSVIVVRYLGPSDFGRLNFAAAVVAIAAVAQLGLESVVVRELVKEPAARNEILGTAFVLMLVSGAIMISIAVIAGEWIGGGNAQVQVMIGVLSLQFLFQSAVVLRPRGNHGFARSQSGDGRGQVRTPAAGSLRPHGRARVRHRHSHCAAGGTVGHSGLRRPLSGSG